MDLYHNSTDTQKCLPFTCSDPNHCKRNNPFCLALRICTFAENNAEKLKNLENLKWDLSKYHYPDSLIKQGFHKALSVPQKDLRKPKKPSNENIIPIHYMRWLDFELSSKWKNRLSENFFSFLLRLYLTNFSSYPQKMCGKKYVLKSWFL